MPLLARGTVQTVGVVRRALSLHDVCIRHDQVVADAYPNFAKMKEYVAPDGVRWRRRGDQVLEGKALARRLQKQDVWVIHHYRGELTEVPSAGRTDFWAQAESRMAESNHSDFQGSEFRNEAGQYLLVVDESC